MWARALWMPPTRICAAQPALLSKLLHSNITDGVEWLLWIGARPGPGGVPLQVHLHPTS
jgi:hypothetical protein